MTVVAVGVDGGGTRTRAVAVDRKGREVGRAEGGAALVDPLRPAAAADTVETIVRQAVGSAAGTLPVSAVWAGLAGAGSEAARAAVETALRDRGLAGSVTVGTDLRAAFHDAFPDTPGILVIAGTGSVATGRSERGEEMRVGGWGALLGDEGSAWRIGLEALRAAVRMSDGRAHPTGLLPAVIEAAGCSSAGQLPEWVAESAKARVAALAPVVVTASDDGDAAAGHIIGEAVAELVDHAIALRDALAPWDGPADIVLGGGLVATPGAPLRTRTVVELEQHGFRVSGRTVDAARGAANLALELVPRS